MKKVLGIIGAIFAGLLGLLGILNVLKSNKQVLADNEKVKDTLKKDDTKIQENNVALAVEEQKREDLKNENPDNSNVVDFFNNRK